MPRETSLTMAVLMPSHFFFVPSLGLSCFGKPLYRCPDTEITSWTVGSDRFAALPCAPGPSKMVLPPTRCAIFRNLCCHLSDRVSLPFCHPFGPPICPNPPSKSAQDGLRWLDMASFWSKIGSSRPTKAPRWPPKVPGRPDRFSNLFETPPNMAISVFCTLVECLRWLRVGFADSSDI